MAWKWGLFGHSRGREGLSTIQRAQNCLFYPCLACLLCSSFACLLSCIYKKSDLYRVALSLGVGFSFSFTRIQIRQAVCRFGLLPLFCLCLSAFLLPWGLRYNINLPCRLPRCGLGIYKPLLCFSCCFPPWEFQCS